MTDPTPHDTTPAEPAPPATAAAPMPAKTPWYGRRVPLLVSGAALILGCLLGGGVVAIAAFAVEDDRGGHSNRDERADRRGNGGNSRHEQNRDGGRNNDQPGPAPSTSASSAPASTPTPSASA
jgi:hypothetical protein